MTLTFMGGYYTALHFGEIIGASDFVLCIIRYGYFCVLRSGAVGEDTIHVIIPLGVVTKSNGKLRLIIDLRFLNKHSADFHFRVELFFKSSCPPPLPPMCSPSSDRLPFVVSWCVLLVLAAYAVLFLSFFIIECFSV